MGVAPGSKCPECGGMAVGSQVYLGGQRQRVRWVLAGLWLMLVSLCAEWLWTLVFGAYVLYQRQLPYPPGELWRTLGVGLHANAAMFVLIPVIYLAGGYCLLKGVGEARDVW